MKSNKCVFQCNIYKYVTQFSQQIPVHNKDDDAWQLIFELKKALVFKRQLINNNHKKNII